MMNDGDKVEGQSLLMEINKSVQGNIGKTEKQPT
jgi:hypothetical protein